MDLIEGKKTELHLHLDGSLRIKTNIELGEKLSIDIFEDKAIRKYLKVNKNDKNLADYLKKFEYPLLVMQNKENLERASYELLEDLHYENYDYAEIRFAPHLHQREGLKLHEVLESVLLGSKKASLKYGIDFGIILCIMRHLSKKDAYDVMELAKGYKTKGVVAIDLAGDEKSYSLESFRDIFIKARKENINYTIHAGEAAGWESVKLAIDLGAKRIGHGIRAYENEDVIDEIVEKDIILEICPISNFQTKILKDMRKYPIKYLMEKGVKLSLNTDNRTISDTNLEKEAKFLHERFGISKKDINEFVKNSKKYSFKNI